MDFALRRRSPEFNARPAAARCSAGRNGRIYQRGRRIPRSDGETLGTPSPRHRADLMPGQGPDALAAPVMIETLCLSRMLDGAPG
jgi:hypothetical protein